MSWSSWKTALKGAAAHASTAAKDSIAQVTGGAKVLRDYTVVGQVATGGTGGLWKIHDARSKKEGVPSVLVSVWVLEKRPPSSMRDSQLTWEGVLELCRKDVAQLGKLKHPGILKLMEPFEETRTQMVIVTERVFASLANVLSDFVGLPRDVQRMNEDIQMSDLERKHGLLQVADTLQFLRGDCNLVHRAICPESIIVVGGTWKLASMGWSMLAEFSADSTTSVHVFNYDATDSELMRLLVPPLNYVAPELISGTRATGALTSATDTYSFAVVAFEILARKPLMAPRSTPSEVAGRLAGLNFMDMPEIDLQLQPVLKSMLSTNINQRPPISSFTGASYFQEDTLVRALRFMDTLLQRDNLQKAAFLKDLTSFWPRFDSRILCYKVLPALLEELRNEAVQALALPLVLRIIAQQPPKDFMDVTLPALLPVAASVKGEALALFTAGAIVLAPSLPPEAVSSLIVPLLARAADHGDARAQEEMLKTVPALAELGALSKEELDVELLPRVCGVCLATTSAPVRTAAVQAMGRLVKLVDENQAIKMLTTCQQVTVVDKTPGTVMCVLGLGGAVAKRWGPELTATNVLPLLTPLLVGPALTQTQFSTAMRAVREMLSSVEAFRGSGGVQQPEVPPAAAALAVPPQDFGCDFGMGAGAAMPAVSQIGSARGTPSPADPFNMIATPAGNPAQKAPDTGFADFVGASAGNQSSHTGYDSLI